MSVPSPWGRRETIRRCCGRHSGNAYRPAGRSLPNPSAPQTFQRQQYGSQTSGRTPPACDFQYTRHGQARCAAVPAPAEANQTRRRPKTHWCAKKHTAHTLMVPVRSDLRGISPKMARLDTAIPDDGLILVVNRNIQRKRIVNIGNQAVAT